MVLQWDVRKDIFLAADGWEPVRLVRGHSGQPMAPDSSGQSGAEQYQIKALRGPISLEEAALSGGKYTATDVIWQIAAEQLPEPPRLGDLIVDSRGVSYRVLQSRLLERTGRYRCVCRHLAIEAGLDNLVDIERAQPSKGPDGVEVLQWSVWRSGLRAKLQVRESQVQIEGDQIASRPRLKIYFAEMVPLDQHCRIRGPDGQRYRILAVRGQDRSDGLMEADLEPIPP